MRYRASDSRLRGGVDVRKVLANLEDVLTLKRLQRMKKEEGIDCLHGT